MTLATDTGLPGSVVTVTGQGFGVTVTEVRWDDAHTGRLLARTTVPNFSLQVTVPDDAPGFHQIIATGMNLDANGNVTVDKTTGPEFYPHAVPFTIPKPAVQTTTSQPQPVANPTSAPQTATPAVQAAPAPAAQAPAAQAPAAQATAPVAQAPAPVAQTPAQTQVQSETPMQALAPTATFAPVPNPNFVPDATPGTAASPALAAVPGSEPAAGVPVPAALGSPSPAATAPVDRVPDPAPLAAGAPVVPAIAAAPGGPSVRTLTADLWSGFASGPKAPSRFGDATLLEHRAAPNGDSSRMAGAGVLAGGLALVSGAGVLGVRRRRTVEAAGR